jgi:hypothetical protein
MTRRAQFPLLQQALSDNECQDSASRHDCAENAIESGREASAARSIDPCGVAAALRVVRVKIGRGIVRE